MRKRLLSILLLCCMVLTLLPTAAFAAGGVEIDETNFPDEKFREYVKTKFDKDNDDILSADEIAEAKEISVEGNPITSFKGIEYFTALTSLECSRTKLTSLDTSYNTELVFLECNEVSTLTSLNVSQNTKLKVLRCNDNALADLNLTNNTALEKLECGGNEFTTLDLSKNTNLKYFGFFNGKLSSLDLTHNTNLEELYFCGNNFSTIDVSQNTKLKYLHLFGNQLITLDTSKNSNLQRLWVYTNPLTSMYLGDSGSIGEVKFDNLPYPITVSTATRTFDLSRLTGFKVDKASRWTNGTVSGNILTVDANATTVTYTYDCGERQATYDNPETTGKLMMPCTLQIKWEDAPNKLTGTVNINGAPKFGETLTANVTDTNNTGTLTYQWYREGKTDPIGTGETYKLVQADIGKEITCRVSSSTETGTIETTVGPVEKADGPAAPVISLRTRTDTEILVTENSAWEYSIDNGANWQRNCLFKDLSPGTEYTIIARVRETATHKPSRNSAPLNVTTMHLAISDELRDKLRAAASAYKGEYDGNEHEAVIVDTTKLPTGWTIAGYTTDGGNSFSNNIPKIKNAGALRVGVKFTHPDYLMNITHYYTAEITPKPLTADMIADIPPQLYTGQPIHPTPEIKDGNTVLVKDNDFTYSYDTNTSPEQGGKVTITGKGNYKDTAFKTFTIVSTITENDLAGLNIPANLVTVKCKTTGDSKAYGRIPGGFDLSNSTPYMDNGVLKAIVKLNLSAYKDKYDADTKKTHEKAGLEGNTHAAFTLKYVNDKWELDGTFPNVVILVKCDGQHPQTPPYPTEENVSGLEQVQVRVQCSTDTAQFKNYGILPGSVSIMPDANNPSQATLTLIPSVYSTQYSTDTGITHIVDSSQTTDNLKIQMRYDPAVGKWMPAGVLTPLVIYVKRNSHDPQTPPYPTEENVGGLERVQVRVQCSTDTAQFKNYGILPGSVSIVPDANNPSQATLTLIPSVYSKQYTIDTGITHSVAPNQNTDNLKIQMRYNSAVGKWMPAGELTPLEVLVQCNNHQGQRYTITFNGNGGTPSVTSMTTIDQKLPELPTATHSGRYSFDGWYTAASGGTKITTATVFYENTAVYAHWTYIGGGGSSGGGGGHTYHTIRAISGLNGSISPSGWTSVRHGWDQTFTITPDKGYAVAKVLVDGKSVGSVKSYTFKNVAKDHTIEVVFMKANGNPQTGVFVDVAEGSYYEEAVDWAVKNGITTGTGNNYFTPDGICTRAQAVTFLWRVAGSPTPKTEAMPFEDVLNGSYYYEAVLWAVENGITVGTSATTFSPELTCSRAHIVTFLWRAANSPSAKTANPFTDVAADAYYIDAVLWAVKHKITVGTTLSTFSPDEGCTRAQIVTFLYRAHSK